MNAKPGRKLQIGERYPNGKLKPHRSEDAPSKIRRIIAMADKGAADPLLGTPIGWLRLHGILTNVQVAAAVEYGRLRGYYDRAIDASPRTSASPSYGAAYALCATMDLTEEEAADLARNNIQAFYEVEKGLVTDAVAGTGTLPLTYGRPGMVRRSSVMALLDRTCVENVQPSNWEHGELIGALNQLAAHFGLTNVYR